ncbi:MAG: bacterial Ig-like domain-containing protein, partial [Clostridiales bacterium]|nr:bacterial Ig-like domain-containing protein [Clostridiales bacterium]
MKNLLKRIIIPVLVFVCAFSGYLQNAFASPGSYRQNKRWHDISFNELEIKYSRGDKFVAVFYGTDGISDEYGDEVFSVFMSSYEKDVYGISLVKYSANDMPDWAWYSLADSSGSFYMPGVIFVQNKSVYKAISPDINSDLTESPANHTATCGRLLSTFKAFFNIKEKIIKSVSLRTKPEKTVYKPGESFDPSGLSLNVEYSDGDVIPVYSGFTCTGFSSDEEKDVTVTVNYQGFTTSFVIPVSEKGEYFYNVEYHQSNARDMLAMVNSFRTDGNGWYWEENNIDKHKTGKMKSLVYDYELEKVAMQRAAEIIADYCIQDTHYRPNGEKFSTAYTGYNAYGENIAYMGVLDTQLSFDSWKEENNPYIGQGHRRNMLSDHFGAIGIACAEYKSDNETLYFWVMSLGDKAKSTAVTPVLDGQKEACVEILNTKIESFSIQTDTENITFTKVSEEKDFPLVSASIQMAVMPYANINLSQTYRWVCVNPSIISVNNGKIKALGEGKTELICYAGTKSISIPVTVTCEHKPGNEKTENVITGTCINEGGYDKVIRCIYCNKI